MKKTFINKWYHSKLRILYPETGSTLVRPAISFFSFFYTTYPKLDAFLLTTVVANGLALIYALCPTSSIFFTEPNFSIIENLLVAISIILSSSIPCSGIYPLSIATPNLAINFYYLTC